MFLCHWPVRWIPISERLRWLLQTSQYNQIKTAKRPSYRKKWSSWVWPSIDSQIKFDFNSFWSTTELQKQKTKPILLSKFAGSPHWWPEGLGKSPWCQESTWFWWWGKGDQRCSCRRTPSSPPPDPPAEPGQAQTQEAKRLFTWQQGWQIAFSIYSISIFQFQVNTTLGLHRNICYFGVCGEQ